MSLDDGLVMQIHAGSRRNHNADIFAAMAATWGSIFQAAPIMWKV
ncbi:MAG: hypothetical protein CM15mP60_1280 [Alphaproteobacteria bacterium]|nr:MAG: hypothetical protein CM15mP60_1280 [Alphaproteobacteria bacterium]